MRSAHDIRRITPGVQLWFDVRVCGQRLPATSRRSSRQDAACFDDGKTTFEG